MLNFRLALQPELAPLVGRRPDPGSPERFETALTQWLTAHQSRQDLADPDFACLIGTTTREWERLRAGTQHYSEDFLYVIAGRLPAALPFVVDVARQQDGWSLYDTWLLWGAACLPAPVRSA